MGYGNIVSLTEALILDLRRTRCLGVKWLRNELIRQHGLALSLNTIHRVLVRHGEQHLDQTRQRLKGTRKYSRPIPGDRVQMDVCKIAPGVYQYTAIDDCSRYKVLGVLFETKCEKHSALPRSRVEEMPFAIQRIQTDRGLEFFAEDVQRRLMEWAIKFRPCHRDRRIDPKATDIEDRLAERQHFWN